MTLHPVTSKENPAFKALKRQLLESGARRTHTLLSGGKLIEAWDEARDTEAGRRLRPAQWLRLEGAEAHPLEASQEREGLNLPGLILPEARMKDLTDMGSPPQHALVMEVGPEPAGPLAAKVVGAWGIQDPGNLGAILRAAAAFGFEEVLLGPGTADPFSPKGLRGAMGAAFVLRLRRCDELPLDEGSWIALDGGPGAIPLAEADLAPPLRLLVGNEGRGWQGVDLPGPVQRAAIPIQGVESLNAAVALGIACYEAARRV